MTSAFCLAMAAQPLASQSCTSDAMLVFDGSWSMAESGIDLLAAPKIAAARRAVETVAPEVTDVRRLGLVTYGPGGATLCTGITLHFAPKPDSADEIIETLNAMTPLGSTPLTQSVALAAEALNYQSNPGAVVLVTDGQETCEGSPCDLAETLATAPDLTVHVIGFRIRSAFFTNQSLDPDNPFATEPAARCLADQTGGIYTSVETLDELIAALRETLGCNLLF